jgi:4-hydroxy-2-oxoheptanedioate aldolase
MDTRKNHFKAALAAGQRQTGLWMDLADPTCTEICASAGFDAVVIDGEHAPNDIPKILDNLRAAGNHSAHPIVRPVIGDVNAIKQILDIGAQTLVVPMVETAEQAELLVRATRYPPVGIRGVAGSIVRASTYGRQPGYLTHADNEICLLVQIETRKGFENLDAIARVEGVDGLFIGPADLSASLGHRGNASHPDVQAAIDHIIVRTRQLGKAPCILTTDVPAAKRHFELGCLFVAVGVDVALLAKATAELAAQFKNRLAAG